MTSSIQLKRDTTANWQAANRVLLYGEVGFEDLVNGLILEKAGDGVTPWNTLGYTNQRTIDVRAFGAKGDGTSDDSQAINNAIAAATTGDVVVFPFTGSSYGVGASAIVVPSGVTLLGAAYGAGYGVVSGLNAGIIPTLKMLNGANLDAVVASNAWWNNRNGIDGYVSVRGVSVNSNHANQTAGLGHGIALCSWRSHVKRCVVDVTGGASSFGILMGPNTRNGSTAAGNAIECHVNENYSYGGLVGIGSQGNQFTDSWLRDNVVIYATTAISCQNNGGAGSVVSGNHIYYSVNGIQIAGFDTSVTDNYIEVSQAGASTGNVYQMQILVLGDGVVVNNNRVMLPTAAVSGNTYWGIFFQWLAAANAVVCKGNTLQGGTSGSDLLSWIYSGSAAGSAVFDNVYGPTNGAVPLNNASPSLITVTQPGPVVSSGTAVLAAGTVTVSDPKVTANTTIRLSNRAIGGTPGALYLGAKTAGTNFTIKSTSASDTSTVYYEVVSY
jgi:hypothetical protein